METMHMPESIQEIARTTPVFKSLTGQQQYHVKVPGTASAAALSVVSFAAVEALGEPYRIVVQLTHPQELNRADYLGKEASFNITPSVIDALVGHVNGEQEGRTFAGCITYFNKRKQTADFHSYEFVIEPLVARLRYTHASRVFQRQTAPQIIEAILRRHDFNGNQFQFKTRRTYPEHAFRLQYQLSDWDFIHLLMQQEGLYSYFTPPNSATSSSSATTSTITFTSRNSRCRIAKPPGWKPIPKRYSVCKRNRKPCPPRTASPTIIPPTPGNASRKKRISPAPTRPPTDNPTSTAVIT